MDQSEFSSRGARPEGPDRVKDRAKMAREVNDLIVKLVKIRRSDQALDNRRLTRRLQRVYERCPWLFSDHPKPVDERISLG